MANYLKRYKQISCRDASGDCDFLAQAETEDQVMEIALDHGCFIHDLCEVSPEAESRMKSLIRDVWA